MTYPKRAGAGDLFISIDVAGVFRCKRLMSTEVIFEDPRWKKVELAAQAKRAANAVLLFHDLDPEICQIDLLACDDARIASLNSDFRAKAAPTNVLSWPAEDLSPDAAGDKPARPQADFTGDIALGDIAIAYETCHREAEAAGKPVTDHVVHLIVHGVLHLLGYDHVRDLDATLMEGLETEILGRLGVDDPYRDTDGA